jgi:hypothetical protein
MPLQQNATKAHQGDEDDDDVARPETIDKRTMWNIVGGALADNFGSTGVGVIVIVCSFCSTRTKAQLTFRRVSIADAFVSQPSDFGPVHDRLFRTRIGTHHVHYRVSVVACVCGNHVSRRRFNPLVHLCIRFVHSVARIPFNRVVPSTIVVSGLLLSGLGFKRKIVNCRSPHTYIVVWKSDHSDVAIRRHLTSFASVAWLDHA